ncbi:vWA domain-containing protein [Cohnella hashimotonis]|uniref:von Willebrand factor type A domain-containing protein n=1 Tax=Cohnella hashimotonis TaxID=2826895 RepID=A0ABT6TQF9_9BACL|nr:von Willebrand factor type A domain-containing protein [Cohnella hashimotonis]MDI4649076.1 von Willebrand factor type A domain-containing protein [Cohnella hashimotonis]
MGKRLGLLSVLLIGALVAGCSSSSDNDSAANRAPESKSQAVSNEAAAASAHDQRASTPSDMFFQDYGTNPYVSAEDDRLSTFAMDVDTGSYTLARSYIKDGNVPPQEAIRLEEFVNYFDLNDAPPKNDTFAIHVDAGPSPFGEAGTQLVRIGIKGKEIESEARKRANLTFVIDVSGSMDEDNRIGLVKRSLELLVNQLKPNDRIGIVVYGSTARTVLQPTAVEDEGAILAAIDDLQIEGSTNAEAGLLLGYKMASKFNDEDAINRVILCSDGVANIGETGPEGILRTIEDYAAKNLYLSTFGFGMDNYNDVLMEQLADKGDGAYAYIDDMDEAKKIFQEQLTETLQTIAKDAKIQVEFDPAQVKGYRLLGYENRAIADEDFRNNKVDGGEVGAGHSVTALYELQLKSDAAKPWGKVTIRYKDVDDNNRSRESSASIGPSDKLSDATLFIAAVAEFAKIMKDSEGVGESRLQNVLQTAEKHASSERQEEFGELVKTFMDIRG